MSKDEDGPTAALTMTRRAAVATGIATLSLSSAPVAAAYCAGDRYPLSAQPIDALLVDRSVAMPRPIAAYVAARQRTLAVVNIALDVAGHTALKCVFATSNVIIGFSSGATLFCVERIAWDHGFRLIGRSQRCDGDLGDDACRQDVLAFLDGTQPFAVDPSALARTYRPSRADGTLHAWAMRKPPARRETLS